MVDEAGAACAVPVVPDAVLGQTAKGCARFESWACCERT
jgi:hypothetical protein